MRSSVFMTECNFRTAAATKTGNVCLAGVGLHATVTKEEGVQSARSRIISVLKAASIASPNAQTINIAFTSWPNAM